MAEVPPGPRIGGPHSKPRGDSALAAFRHRQQAHTGAINPPSTGPPAQHRDAGTFVNTNPHLPQAAGGLPMVIWDKTDDDCQF